MKIWLKKGSLPSCVKLAQFGKPGASMIPSCIARTTDMSHGRWLQERQRGIGGSEIAAALGVSRWQSPYALYMQKRGEVPADEANEAMEAGTRLESTVVEWWADRHPDYRVQRCNYMLVHPEYPWWIGNPDRRIYHPVRGWGVLECKTTSAWAADDWANEQVPDQVYLQLQHYLELCSAAYGIPHNYGYFATLIGGQRLIHPDVKRDTEIAQHIARRGAEFWRDVCAGNPPPVDNSKSTADTLAALYPDGREEAVELPHSLAALCSRYADMNERIRELEAQKRGYANQLKAALGEHHRGRTVGWDVSWAPTKRSSVDMDKLRADYPDAAEACTKTTTSRRFATKRHKEDPA